MSITSEYNEFIEKEWNIVWYCSYRRYLQEWMDNNDIRNYIKKRDRRRKEFKWDYERFRDKYWYLYLRSTYIEKRKQWFTDKEIAETQMKQMIYNARRFIYECYIDEYIFWFNKNAYLKYHDMWYSDEDINRLYKDKGWKIKEEFTKENLEYIKNCNLVKKH
jgi:hypothetical protein